MALFKKCLLKLGKFFMLLSLITFTLAIAILLLDTPWLSYKIATITFLCYAAAVLGLSIYVLLNKETEP